MPLYKHYSDQIKSDVADIRNTGKKRYGSLLQLCDHGQLSNLSKCNFYPKVLEFRWQ